MTKSRADGNVSSGTKNAASASSAIKQPDIEAAATELASGGPTVGTTVATIGIIGIAAALFDVALIPGIVIGVAAAYAPKYVPGLGDRLGSLFNSTVRGAYKMTRSAFSAVGGAQERRHDVAAEVAAGEAAEADGPAPARSAS